MRRQLHGIRLLQRNGIATVAQLAAPRTEHGERAADAVGGFEGRERRRIGRGIEAHHDQAVRRPEGHAWRKIKIHRAAQAPGVGRGIRVVESDRGGGAIGWKSANHNFKLLVVS